MLASWYRPCGELAPLARPSFEGVCLELPLQDAQFVNLIFLTKNGSVVTSFPPVLFPSYEPV